jgi:EAL domain-containing protein (putative c-di-GMP-specific phosphodiesterase class I)
VPNRQLRAGCYAETVTRLTESGSMQSAQRVASKLTSFLKRKRWRPIPVGAKTGGLHPGIQALSLLVACFSMLCPAAGATNGDVGSVDARPAALSLEELRRAWLGQLDQLIARARELAVSDDTYEFVKRPNIPYVYAHYEPEQLAAERIDTVLIINLRGKPLFWRRLNQGRNRGFPDARRFLAELPPLRSVGVAGAPTLAGAAQLVHGPKLLVAMPIYASSGSGAARGWLIATRALDALQWSRYEQLAHVPEEPPGSIVRLESTEIPSFFPVPDLELRALKTADVSLVQQDAVLASSGPSFSSSSTPLLTLLFVGTSVTLIATGIMRRQGRRIASLRAPRNGNGHNPIEMPSSGGTPATSDTPISTRPGHMQDPLAACLAARNAVFRFQPQIDLQTGKVAGVEALLCVPGAQEFRSAIELTAEIEASGHGLALVERRLQMACREQSAWLKRIGHEFSIGVPISRRTLANAAFLPLVQRILADNELAPSFLELQVEDAVIGASPAAPRSINKIRDAGITIAIDGFNAARSNLRLLSILPISKLRVDPCPLLRDHDGPSAARLFAGIFGAARGLGISVCATGINSPELLSAVLQHGRPLAQGATIGPILTGEGFLELLRGSNVDTAILPTLDFDDEGLRVASAPEPMASALYF